MKLALAPIACLISVAFLFTACGSSSSSTTCFPNLLELGQAVVPQVESSSRSFTATLRDNSPSSHLLRTVTYDGTSGDLSTQLPAIAEVFGNNLSGVNTQLVVQLKLANGYMADAATRYVAADGSFQNCDHTITDSDTGFGTPFFKDSAESIFFEGTSGLGAGYDAGKYSCFATWTSNSAPNAIAFGREAITATTGCTDAFRYYVITGYSTPSGQATGHQIQKLFYDGCTKQIAIAMHIGTSVPTFDSAASGGTSQGFNGRFELIGNAGDHSFTLRVGKMDVFPNGDSIMNLINASGVATPSDASAPSHFAMRFKAFCNEDGVCSSPVDKTFCLAATYSHTLSVESTTSSCTGFETNFQAVNPFGYADVVGTNETGHTELTHTGIAMSAAAFGL